MEMKLLKVKFDGLESAVVEIEVIGGNTLKEIDRAIDIYNFMQKRLEENNNVKHNQTAKS